MTVDGSGQQFHGSDQDSEGIGGEGDGEVKGDFHDGEQVLRRSQGEARGRAKVSFVRRSIVT